jgi:hypothetical protein
MFILRLERHDNDLRGLEITKAVVARDSWRGIQEFLKEK